MAYISKVESHEKAANFSYSDGFMTIYGKIGLLSVYVLMNAINILSLIEQWYDLIELL